MKGKKWVRTCVRCGRELVVITGDVCLGCREIERRGKKIGEGMSEKTYTAEDVKNIADCAKIQADMSREYIQELEAENERLKEAMRDFITAMKHRYKPDDIPEQIHYFIDMFKQLLEETKNEII